MTHTCPCCSSPNTEFLLSTPPVPVNSCVLVNTLDESMSIERRSIDLWWCGQCEFLWNSAFESALVDYGQNYEGTQSFSKLFRTYSEALAKSWIEDLNQAPKVILEAGCGQGEFLALLSEVSPARLIGFDPAYREKGVSNAEIHPSRLPQSQTAMADLVINRMTLEHVAEPAAFIRTQKSWLTEAGHLISQVPNAERMLDEQLTCDLLYEHVNYFTKRSISALMATCGLAIRQLNIEFNGQHLSAVAQHSAEPASLALPAKAFDPTGFTEAVAAFPTEWHKRLKVEKLAGREIWVWGAGSRATAFMSNLPDPDCVSGVIDINPNRKGTFVLGSSWVTFTPEHLRGCKGLTIIVMNPIYLDEISQVLSALNIEARLIPL